jgi:hypothetical protein
MTELVIRPDDWNLPLLLHVGGAMVAVGALIAAAGCLLLSSRSDDSAGLTRLGFRTLLFAGIPAYLVMRLAAEWIKSREGYGSDEPSWIGIGYATSDASFVLIIIATILTGLAARRLARDGSGERLGRIGGVLIGLVLVLLTVAVWAMTTKPT